MIPLRLRVKNFMCYTETAPTLDLESIHVACLCGDNGNGKSALLDAVTWVLWGQARAKTQDELVHLGKQDMAVELDFLARDQLYRVSRRHSRSGRSRQGATILELQVESDNGFVPITGNTIRDTESKIRDILHLDYDTFVNTAFLMQGKADMFTSSTPSKRKECLAEVLDLSYYQSIEEEARGESRGIQEQIRDIERTVEMRRDEIARKPEYEKELAAVVDTLAQLEPESDAQRRKIEELRGSVGQLQVKRQDLEAMARRLSGAQEDIAQLEQQMQGTRSRIDDYQTAKQHESEVRHNFAILKAARSGLELLNQALAQRSEIDGEKAELEQYIAVHTERLTSRAAQLNSRISNDLEPRAARIPEIRRELEVLQRAEEKLASLEGVIGLKRAKLEELNTELEALDHKQAQATELDMQRTRLKGEIALQKERLSNQINQMREKINDLQPKAQRLEEIENALRRFSSEEDPLQEMVDSVQQKRQEAEDVVGRARYLKQTNEKLLKDMDEARKKFDLLAQGDAVCPLCMEPLDIEGKERLRQEYEDQGFDQKRQYTENQTELAGLSEFHKQLTSAIAHEEKELNGLREHVQGKVATLERDANESRNALKGLRQVSGEFEQMIAAITNDDYAAEDRRKLAAIESELHATGYDAEARQQTQVRIRGLNDEIVGMDTDLNQGRIDAEGKMAVLERELEEAEKAEQELEPSVLELEEARTRLNSNEFAREERQRLAEINAKLALIGYDAEKHRKARDQVKALEQYDGLHRKLVEADENLPHLQSELETTRKMRDRRKQEMTEDERRTAALEQDLSALPSLEVDLEARESAYQELQKRKDAVLVKQGVLRQHIERCNTLQSEISDQEKRRRDLAEEKGIYDDLTGAFGKNGIQALIIEGAIPQIEADANELLGRLTENRMFLKLQLTEGRRDRITHLPTEELDIKIADEIGTRSYETFSGGEAFRINFALRIALSKLLARRSGAPLPILFIDEGFGSQDRSGQERLTEAIQSIQDDFQKIIVITHIDQIKEAFPVRIEVTKTETGSEFVLV